MRLGKTNLKKINEGAIKSYQEPFSRREQIDLMESRHHIKIANKKIGEKILQRVPYNLLVYPTLKIWYAKSPKGKMFMANTTIENLYELYRFDSFLKGKILELVRAFENMFLGSLAYHYEFEYKSITEKMGPKLTREIKNHNVGFQKKESASNSDIVEYDLIPLWQEFFSENSKIDINREIMFWESLQSSKFLVQNKQNELFRDKQNAPRFLSDEIKFVKSKFKPATVREQCVQDVVRFSSVTVRKWKLDIGNSNFSELLNIIRIFRNSASHPGYIINQEACWKASLLDKKFNGRTIQFVDFIDILPYFLPRDLILDFKLAVQERLLMMNAKNDISIRHLQRIENKIGIKIIS
ncbi:MAG: Abi family protein [Leuconostoc mesenteroides]|jgi:abortive infection bacteriophage resistance protein|nr:Abi family protein [Lactococcus lactis]MCI2152147.1 Abi family protein [Leuconostoc mesenteroides]MCI2167312.1 Abi family protein [Leuconostoc mesenteroides]